MDIASHPFLLLRPQIDQGIERPGRAIIGRFGRFCDNLRHFGDGLRGGLRGWLFCPLNAAAVNDEDFVADWYSGHVQAFVDEPECMAGLQSLLYMGPDGAKSSHQLRGILKCERFDGG
jgi:hypothetical protein